jgi:hypothetical protein
MLILRIPYWISNLFNGEVFLVFHFYYGASEKYYQNEYNVYGLFLQVSFHSSFVFDTLILS